MVNRKELRPESSPRAAYGALLRRSREEKGWKQEDLASHMEYSSTHISAVETGRKVPTSRFAHSADHALGTGDLFQRECRKIKHGALLEGFAEYVAYSGRAVEFRLYEIGIIPGLLQTPEYAQVLADSAVQRGSTTPEQAAERLSALATRQQDLKRSRPPMMWVVMDESCIRRPVGGLKVMNDQLDHLLAFASLPNTVLQVAPFAIGERRSINLPVTLLTLPDRSVLCYAESQTQGHLDREMASVLPVLTAYHQLQAEALSQAASVAMISQLRKGTQ